jgi:hypothetical protein
MIYWIYLATGEQSSKFKPAPGPKSSDQIALRQSQYKTLRHSLALRYEQSTAILDLPASAMRVILF